MTEQGQIGIAVVGLGYWGSNVARNLDSIDGCRLVWCCDLDQARAAVFDDASFTDDLAVVLADPAVEAIAIATPVPSHPEIALRALDAGKHCFVEKPMAQTVADAEALVLRAQSAGLVLMAGHLLEYHPGVEELKSIIAGGHLGEVHYLYSQRLNLGQLRRDENALWSLGAHDVSVVLALTEEFPLVVSARGESYVRDGVEDMVFCFMRFESGVVAHLHLSWLDPHKSRSLTVVGSDKMVVFDDMESDRKVTIYDKGITQPRAETYGEYVGVRSGDISMPRIASDEPLRLEVEEFAASIREQRAPVSDGHSGIAVVEVLAGLQRSLDEGGAVITVDPSLA
jgi:predicted dehydrogenase